MSVTNQELTPQWETYLDLQNDVKPYLQFPTGSSTSDVRLQLIVDFACQWVQNYLGRPVAPTEFFRRFSGWTGLQGAFLNLPYYPVIQMVSVVEYWGANGPHTLTEQTPANQSANDVYQMDYLRGTVIRAFRGLMQRPWFPGSRNIEITWVAGYNPIPADLKIATLELIAHWWRNTQQASRSNAPAGMAEYDSDVGPGMWAGVPHRVTALLSPYSQQAIG